MLPEKPAHMSKAQWHLVERMCCYNPLDRISASAVVRELEVFAQEFDLPEMEGEELESWSDLGDVELSMSVSDEDDEPTVASILAEIDEMCGQSTTTDAMNRDVYNRLLDVFEQLEMSTDIPVTGLVQQFIRILKFFYFRLKSTNSVGSAQAARLAMSRQGADNSFSVHGDLDLLMEAAKLSTSAQVHNWRTQWETQRLKLKNAMLTKLEDLPALMEDVGNENEREEALTYLSFELSKHPTSYTTSKATEFTQAKNIVTSLSVSRNASWFIPAYEVEFDKFDEFSRGAFGKVYHGKWKRSRVVVKKVKFRNEEERAAFLNEVEIWYKLFHPHVVQMFGACHIQRPFFVCEYAGRGQLDHYLRKHPTELWQKLHEAALGLRYLHVKRIVHGDLKCNNILIGNDSYAKLTDFGLSTLVSHSSEENEEPEAELESKGEHTIGAIRWKASEILCGEKATFESDVYSFGMCILEAVSGKYPWGVTIPDAAVKIHVVKRKKIPMCPANCSEDAYHLVERMCRYMPSERIGMAKVVEELTMIH